MDLWRRSFKCPLSSTEYSECPMQGLKGVWASASWEFGIRQGNGFVWSEFLLMSTTVSMSADLRVWILFFKNISLSNVIIHEWLFRTNKVQCLACTLQYCRKECSKTLYVSSFQFSNSVRWTGRFLSPLVYR